jgi:signal transduction histidine kinase/CheY-like chemotaxis protein
MALILYRLWRTYRLQAMRDLAMGWGLWTMRMVVVSYSAALRSMGEPPGSPQRRLLTMVGVGLALGALPYLMAGTIRLAKGEDVGTSPNRWSLGLATFFMLLSVLATTPGAPDNLRLAVLLFSSTVSFALVFGYVAWQLLRVPADDLTSARQLAAVGFGAYAIKQIWNLKAFVQAGPPEAAASAVTENIVLFLVAMSSIVLLFDRLRQRSVLAEREQRRLEAELQARDHLDSLGRLAGGVAHDFNNMLTSILGNAQLARMRVHDAEDPVEELDEIESTATRASALTKQLLAIARRERVQPVRFDLVARVRRVSEYLRRELDASIRLDVQLPAEALYIRADPDRMDQAVINLVFNAQDALRQGDEGIRLTVARSPALLAGRAAVQLTVEDDGVGMEDAVRGRIFEPFFTTKGPDQGTGLGLSILYGAVTQAQGLIAVHSIPGKGSRFELQLPLVEPGETAEYPVVPFPESSFANTRVLVVDDDPLVRRVAVRLLQKSGFQVVEAGDAEEALGVHAAQDTPVQLLLTDIVMPGDNGRTLARLLRARDAQLAVVYMSGYEADAFTDEPDAPEGPFVAKPFSEAQLIAAIRRGLAAVRTNAPSA